MRNRKKTLAIALGMMLMTSSAFAAADSPVVPASNWTYSAINLLADQGIIKGYTLKGKTMTREEMAQWVAMALNNEDKATPVQRTLIEKLGIEFSLEMNHIAAPAAEQPAAAPANTSKATDSVKFSGLIQETYKNNMDKTVTTSYGQQRVELNIDAKVDDTTSAHLRIANPTPSSTNFKDTTTTKFGQNDSSSMTIDRFYGESKVGIFDLNIGRQSMAVDPEDIIVDSKYFSYDGLDVNWKQGDIKFDAKRGRFASNLSTNTNVNNSGSFVATPTTNYNTVNPFNGFAAANFANVDVNEFKISQDGRFNWLAGWAQFWNPTNNTTLMNYLIGRVGYHITPYWSVAGQYAQNRANLGGHYWMLSTLLGDQKLNAKGKQNFYVQYANVSSNMIYNNYSSSSFVSPAATSPVNTTGDAFKNLELSYRYAFSSNLNIAFTYWYVYDMTHNINKASFSYDKVVLAYRF